MSTKTKLPVREAIPDGFADFMRYVVDEIDRGDMSAWTESDDLLQCEKGYGGLFDEAGGRYGFEYLVDDSDEEERKKRGYDICWYFDLDRQQIRDIACGKVTQLPFWRCNPDCGRRFPASDYYCEECDFPPD